MLFDHTLEYYCDNIECKNFEWDHTVQLTEAEFNSEVQMETVANGLVALHIQKFESDSVNEERALKMFAQENQSLTPQVT